MERSFSRRVDALDSIFAFIDDVAQVHTLDPDTVFAVEVAVEELFTNMVKYNASGASGISIRFERRAEALDVSLTDFDADPFDPTAEPVLDLGRPLAERPSGGLGLHLVRLLMDDCRYEHRDRCSTITLTKKLTP